MFFQLFFIQFMNKNVTEKYNKPRSSFINDPRKIIKSCDNVIDNVIDNDNDEASPF